MNVFPFILLQLCLLFANEESAVSADPYSLLVEIPAFTDLFTQKGLTTYSADVQIIGPIRKYLDGMASEKGLRPPEFHEMYDAKRGFAFRIKNASYPVMLKKMIEESFVPVLVFDRVISVMESKREFSWFQRFRNITRCDAKYIQYEDAPHIRLTFTAIADSSIETRVEGVGATEKTIKTKSMTFILNPKTKLVRQLKLEQLESGSDKKNMVEKKFLFKYIRVANRDYPLELSIEKDGKEEIKFTATYQTIGSFTVFAEKKFSFAGADGTPETITIKFGKYSFNKEADLSSWESGTRGKDALTREAEAEKIYQKARTAIMDGDTNKAKSLLKKIIKEYPQTTVASQASTLLEGIP